MSEQIDLENQLYKFEQLKLDARTRAQEEAGNLLKTMLTSWGYNHTRAAEVMMGLQFFHDGQLVTTRIF